MRGAVVVALVVAGCTSGNDPRTPPAPGPNDGLLRDFIADAKFDADGHPLNAEVTHAEALCPTATPLEDGVVELAEACVGPLAGAKQRGALVASVRYRLVSATADVRFTLRDATGATLAEETITTDRVRNADDFSDLPLAFASDGGEVTLEIAPSADTLLELAYVETFPQRFRLVLSPGSGVLADDDELTIELPADARLPHITLDGVDLSARLEALVAADPARDVSTAYRRILRLRAADLLPERGERADLFVTSPAGSARALLLRNPPPCDWEGQVTATTRILVTGFQPFPANAWHENISEVAVRALRPARVRGAALMRLVLPVEFDRAATLVTETAARCGATAVVSFGQGGSALALEESAYNLQDTSEVAGGVPDNRGVIAIARTIDPTGSASRPSGLPLAAIERALDRLDQPWQRSDDPGRYICNNVFYRAAGQLAVAGFVHLPYTTTFTATSRAHWGRIAEAILTAVAAS